MIGIRISNDGRKISNMDSNTLENLGEICNEIKITHKSKE